MSDNIINQLLNDTRLTDGEQNAIGQLKQLQIRTQRELDDMRLVVRAQGVETARLNVYFGIIETIARDAKDRT